MRDKKDGSYQRTLPLLESLLRDFRLGLRTLATNRGLSLIAILALTLGIGASTIMFSVISSVFVNALPYKNLNRLVAWSSLCSMQRADSRFHEDPQPPS